MNRVAQNIIYIDFHPFIAPSSSTFCFIFFARKEHDGSFLIPSGLKPATKLLWVVERSGRSRKAKSIETPRYSL